MPRSINAQAAVDLYETFRLKYGWSASDAWHGIARLLLSCNVWNSGWQPFHGVVVYRERNDFKLLSGGTPNRYLQRAEDLSVYLADELNVARERLCDEIGLYWKQPGISDKQPHNLVGHAFRSIVVNILQVFGDKGITYTEETDPRVFFPGFQLSTRSPDARLDIVGHRGDRLVSLLSTRWRYRHDRVDLLDEAMAYAPPARRQNPDCKLYAVVGEFSPTRLHKVLSNCPPAFPNAALSAAVHFAPQLLTDGLDENGRVSELRSLEWLIEQTYTWR